MRVKGKYVTTIEVDIDYDDENEAFLSLEDVKYTFSDNSLKYKIAGALQRYVFDRMPCKLTINEQCKDLHCTKGDA